MSLLFNYFEALWWEVVKKLLREQALVKVQAKLRRKLSSEILSLRDGRDECVFLDFIHTQFLDCRIIAHETGEKFILPIPDSYRESLCVEYKFNYHEESKEQFMPGLLSLIRANYPEIQDIDGLIDECREEAARFFLSALQKGASKHNNFINGIDHITKSDDGRDLRIWIFGTDYYTYNCMMCLYRKLREKKNIFKLNSLNDIEKVKYFTSSCGIGGFVILDYHGHEYLLVSKRSSTAACPQHWHFSFDETFDTRDKTSSITKHLSIKECLGRALEEEVNLSEDFKMSEEMITVGVIQNENRFEFEIFLNIRVWLNDVQKDIEKIIDDYHEAPDAENENSEMHIIPVKEVGAFLEKRQKVTPESKLWVRAYMVSSKPVYKIFNV